MPTRVTRWDTRYATVVAFFAWTFAVYDYLLFGTLLPKIAAELGWTTALSTLVASVVAFGAFIISLALAPVVDLIGRRRSMMLTVGGTAAASGLTALSFTIPYVVGVRSLSGLGYSEQAVNATYLNEVFEVTEDEFIRRNRGFVYSLVQGGWPIGALIAAGLSALLVPIVGWRGSFLVATFPALLLIFMRIRLKETPQYQFKRHFERLVSDGKESEAHELAAARGVDIADAQKTRATYLTIFRGRLLRNTVFLALAFFLNWFGTQVFSVLGTTVLTRAQGVSFRSSLIVLVGANAIAFVGYVFHGWVGDKTSRRSTIAVGWILGGVCYAIAVTVAAGPFMVFAFYALGLFFQIGPYSALLFYMAECYSTDTRGTGTVFINALGPIGAIVSGSILSSLLAAQIPMSFSAAVVGALGTSASGLLILGARPVVQPTTLRKTS